MIPTFSRMRLSLAEAVADARDGLRRPGTLIIAAVALGVGAATAWLGWAWLAVDVTSLAGAVFSTAGLMTTRRVIKNADAETDRICGQLDATYAELVAARSEVFRLQRQLAAARLYVQHEARLTRKDA